MQIGITVKVTDTAPSHSESIKDVKRELKSQKTGKVTAVVTVMTIFKKTKGSLRSTTKKSSYLALKSKDLASKRTKLELKLAKIGTARVIKPKLSRSMGLVASKKESRVLLDSGSSGDLLLKKGKKSPMSRIGPL